MTTKLLAWTHRKAYIACPWWQIIQIHYHVSRMGLSSNYDPACFNFRRSNYDPTCFSFRQLLHPSIDGFPYAEATWQVLGLVRWWGAIPLPAGERTSPVNGASNSSNERHWRQKWSCPLHEFIYVLHGINTPFINYSDRWLHSGIAFAGRQHNVCSDCPAVFVLGN